MAQLAAQRTPARHHQKPSPLRLLDLALLCSAIQVGNIHHESDVVGIPRIHKCSNVGDPKGAKELLAFSRREPVIRVLYIMMSNNGWHDLFFRGFTWAVILRTYT